MQLTVEDIKDIVRSKKIDDQQLKEVNLSKHSQYLEGNNIGDEGCKNLTQANWPNLQILDLGKYY